MSSQLMYCDVLRGVVVVVRVGEVVGVVLPANRSK